MYTVVKEFIKARYIIPRMNRKSLYRYQEKLKRKQLAFIKKKSPFYRERRDFPIISKKEMMTEYNRLNTCGLDREQMLELALTQEQERKFDTKYHGISAGLSSGTSGQRGLYTLSKKEELMWAGNALGKLLPKRWFRSYNIAFFMRANNPIYSQLDKPFFRFRYYDIFRDFQELMQELIQQNPSIIIAPATVLWDIALYFEERNQPLPKCIKIISVAEVLDNGELLAEKFGLEHIDQVYQCTEGFLAFTCSKGNFHLNEDSVYFEHEWLEDEGDVKRFLPIISDLKRRVQPMIRYRMTDILIHKEGICDCGSPLAMIERVEGRQDDYLVFNDRVVYADQIRRLFLLQNAVRWYQVRQLSDQSLIISIDTKEGFREKVEQDLQFSLKELGATSICFEEFQRDRSQKLKRVIRERKEEL